MEHTSNLSFIFAVVRDLTTSAIELDRWRTYTGGSSSGNALLVVCNYLCTCYHPRPNTPLARWLCARPPFPPFTLGFLNNFSSRCRAAPPMLMRQTVPGEFNWNLAIIKRLHTGNRTLKMKYRFIIDRHHSRNLIILFQRSWRPC